MIEVDRDKLIKYMGGNEAVEKMDFEQRTDALEHYLEDKLAREVEERRAAKKRYPTVAELEAGIEKRAVRRGIGKIFKPAPERFQGVVGDAPDTVRRFAPMPEAPTLEDFFELRFRPADHVLQSARLAQQKGLPEETILACLLHDLGNYLARPGHGHWSAQMIEPYVSPKVTFAVKYHEVLRFFPDPDVGYDYPARYYQLFGEDFKPTPFMMKEYEYVRNHEWYMEARLVTLNDYYAFDASVEVPFSDFRDIVGRHFRQPKEGLGYDNSSASHVWRTLIFPDNPL